MYVAAGLDLPGLKNDIVQPALHALSWDNGCATDIVTGTALAESGAKYLRQIGGPAEGLWQMEEATHDDIWNNYLVYHPVTVPLLLSVCGLCSRPDYTTMRYNLRYGAVMCRAKYIMAPAPLPAALPLAMAQYHKTYYNTVLGKADPVANVPLFRAAMAA